MKTKEITVASSLKSLKPIGQRHGKDIFLDNPFIECFSVEVRKKSVTVAAGLSISDKDNNEIKAGAVSMFQEVDTEEFLKIYTQNVKTLFELSTTAQKVLMPLMMEIQKTAKNVAHVYLSHGDVKKNCKALGLSVISQPTFSRGIAELIDRDFLAVNAKGPNWYWINPNILFNGDRVRFIQDYKIKRKEEKYEELPEQLKLF